MQNFVKFLPILGIYFERKHDKDPVSAAQNAAVRAMRTESFGVGTCPPCPGRDPGSGNGTQYNYFRTIPGRGGNGSGFVPAKKVFFWKKRKITLAFYRAVC